MYSYVFVRHKFQNDQKSSNWIFKTWPKIHVPTYIKSINSECDHCMLQCMYHISVASTKCTCESILEGCCPILREGHSEAQRHCLEEKDDCAILETVCRLMLNSRAVWVAVKNRSLRCLKWRWRSVRRLEMRGRPLRGLPCVSPVNRILWHRREMVDRLQFSLLATSAWSMPASSRPWALHLSSPVNLRMFFNLQTSWPPPVEISCTGNEYCSHRSEIIDFSLLPLHHVIVLWKAHIWLE